MPYVVGLIRWETIVAGQHPSPPVYAQRKGPSARRGNTLEPCRRHVIQHEPKLIRCQDSPALGDREEKLIGIYS